MKAIGKTEWPIQTGRAPTDGHRQPIVHIPEQVGSIKKQIYSVATDVRDVGKKAVELQSQTDEKKV